MANSLCAERGVDRSRSPAGGVRLLIAGAYRFQWEVGFAIDEERAVITQLVRVTLGK